MSNTAFVIWVFAIACTPSALFVGWRLYAAGYDNDLVNWIKRLLNE
jgi:hypothetical protein